MVRRYRKQYDEEEDGLGKLIEGLGGLYLICLIFLYIANRASFWRWLIYGFIFLVIIVLGVWCWRMWRENIKQKRLERLIEKIRNAGQENYIINFINRFGFEGKKGKSWVCRDYLFDWERINDLERVLLENNINLRADKEDRDVYKLLRYYIQQKEEKLTRESIREKPQKFANLTGSEFEKLIYRLFTAMGYSVQWIGKSGDQGGDLIANKDGERLLIQAKCYKDWSVGNEAVQQVVAAMKYYDCNKATVITTSYFTSEAIALAKANNTELVPKERLQEMLLKYLNESWG